MKKTLVILLALVLSLGVLCFGCSNGNDEPVADPVTDPVETTAADADTNADQLEFGSEVHFTESLKSFCMSKDTVDILSYFVVDDAEAFRASVIKNTPADFVDGVKDRLDSAENSIAAVQGSTYEFVSPIANICVYDESGDGQYTAEFSKAMKDAVTAAFVETFNGEIAASDVKQVATVNVVDPEGSMNEAPSVYFIAVETAEDGWVIVC